MGATSVLFPRRPHLRANLTMSASPAVLLLDVQEAARMIGIGRSKLYELIRKGDLPVVHIGRAVRVPTAALRVLVDQMLAEQSDGD